MANIKKINGPIEIICNIDAAYASHLAVMLTSLAASNRRLSIRVHVLHDGVDVALRARVASCVPQLEINWIEVKDHSVLDIKNVLHLTRAANLRLMMLEILPKDIKRILYLDVDLIVNGSLLPLWSTELSKQVCAAVEDPGVSAVEFAQKWNLSNSGKYFNAGMMLLNLEKLRNEPLLENAADILVTSTSELKYGDQDALNIAFWNKWLPVDPAWNLQRRFFYNRGPAQALPPTRLKPAIIHYTENYKPWRRNDWHPYAWLYIRYLAHTSFYKDVLRAGHISLRDQLNWRLRWYLNHPTLFGKHRFQSLSRPLS